MAHFCRQQYSMQVRFYERDQSVPDLAGRLLQLIYCRQQYSMQVRFYERDQSVLDSAGRLL